MSSGGRDGECPFCVLLPMNMRKIHTVSGSIFYLYRRNIGHHIIDRLRSCEDIDRFTKRFYRNKRHIRNHRRFPIIVIWQKHISLVFFSCENGRGQHARNCSHASVEREFPDKIRIFRDGRLIFLILREDAERDGEIVERSFFPQICGSEIDGNARTSWKLVS